MTVSARGLPEVYPSHSSTESIRQLVQEKTLAYQPFTLDSGQTAIFANHDLLSQADLQKVDRRKPVVLLVHGFTSTTYEWNDFAKYLDQTAKGTVLYSKILLGGHGRSLKEFKVTTWQEWGKPILDEYRALVSKGFTNISMAGVSTACALILEQISSGFYTHEKIQPKNIFFIDPLVKPISSWEKLLVCLGALFKQAYKPTQAFTPEEFAHWYGWRPYSTLKSLDDLAEKVNSALTSKIHFPPGTNFTLWASQRDPTVDPDGYKVIQQGIVMNAGGTCSFTPVDSKLHVFTRLSGRPIAPPRAKNLSLTREEVIKHVATAPIPFTRHDRCNQKRAFETMLMQMRPASSL